MEEGENHHLKRIRFEEEDEDLISKLPDSLIVEIVSRLPSTKYAIRTGILSKRWMHLWTYVSNLIFEHPCKLPIYYPDECHPNPDFFSYVDKTLAQRPQLKLNKCILHSHYNHLLQSHINNWIRYAVACNVEHLNLRLWDLKLGTLFPLHPFFFVSSCFTHLTLAGCGLNPAGAISWKNLRNLSIVFGKLDEDMIENVLSGSPVLETLVLTNCHGYKRLNITSTSVKNLVFDGYRPSPDLLYDLLDTIEINAPNISTLKIQDEMALKKLLLLNVSSLVEAHLDDGVKLLGPFGKYHEEDQEEMLKGLILDLQHVNDFKIGSSCSKVLTRLKAKGFISPSNLKVLDVTSSPLL